MKENRILKQSILIGGVILLFLMFVTPVSATTVDQMHSICKGMSWDAQFLDSGEVYYDCFYYKASNPLDLVNFTFTLDSHTEFIFPSEGAYFNNGVVIWPGYNIRGSSPDTWHGPHITGLRVKSDTPNGTKIRSPLTIWYYDDNGKLVSISDDFNGIPVGIAAEPIISAPIYAGANRIYGKTTDSYSTSVELTINGESNKYVGDVSDGTWSILVPVLKAGDVVTVQAYWWGTRSNPATATVVPAPVPLTITAHSPVYMTVTDPEGNVISITQNQIPGATYIETGSDSYGYPDGIITIPDPKPGDYLIAVTPRAGAASTDVYTITTGIGDALLTLANNVPVQNIPAVPYGIHVSSTGEITIIDDPGKPVPEFPSVFLPAALIISIIGVGFLLRRHRET